MSSQRYNLDTVAVNNNKLYKKYLENTRGRRRGISHFRTQTFRYPTQEEISSLITSTHVWKVGDRFSKLAHEHYGDVEMWWVIAMFNQSPTEAHVKKGELIFIPQPLDRVMDLFIRDDERY